MRVNKQADPFFLAICFCRGIMTNNSEKMGHDNQKSVYNCGGDKEIMGIRVIMTTNKVSGHNGTVMVFSFPQRFFGFFRVVRRRQRVN